METKADIWKKTEEKANEIGNNQDKKETDNKVNKDDLNRKEEGFFTDHIPIPLIKH